MHARMFAVTALAAVSMAAVAEAGEDRGKARHDSDRSGSYEVREAHRAGKQYRYQGRRRSADSEADIIRAESCDPGGRFDAYPAWARSAFTCGSQR